MAVTIKYNKFINVRQEIESGLAEAKRGEFASDDEVKDAFKKWAVQSEA